MRLGAGLVKSGTFFESEVEEYKRTGVAGVDVSDTQVVLSLPGVPSDVRGGFPKTFLVSQSIIRLRGKKIATTVLASGLSRVHVSRWPLTSVPKLDTKSLSRNRTREQTWIPRTTTKRSPRHLRTSLKHIHVEQREASSVHDAKDTYLSDHVMPHNLTLRHTTPPFPE